MGLIKNPAEIAAIRQASRIAQQVLEEVGRQLRPGMTTLEVDEFAAETIPATGPRVRFWDTAGSRGIPASR